MRKRAAPSRGAPAVPASQQSAPPSVGRRIRVATYNVHGCVGMDRRYAPSRIAAVLQALRPDIMALQEVDSRRPHHEGLPQFKYFEQITGLHAVAGPSVRDAHGEYGNLLLTRFPVTAVLLDLTVAGRCEPRTAVDVDLDTPEGPLRVVALHVGLSKVERATQFHRLIEALGDLTKAGTPVLLMGDFNEWAPRTGTRLTAITAQFPSVISPAASRRLRRCCRSTVSTPTRGRSSSVRSCPRPRSCGSAPTICRWRQTWFGSGVASGPSNRPPRCRPPTFRPADPAG